MKFFLCSKEKKAASPDGTGRVEVYILFALSLLFFLLVRYSPFGMDPGTRTEMLTAADTMREAMHVLGRCRLERGVIIDERFDPNRTGFIGLEHSVITTTAGNLEAKRTAANPDFAALIVHLLKESGARPGDAVAIGASSSFPSLIVASLAAAEAVGVKPLLVVSLGASQWGANNPDFHWLVMQDCLRAAGRLTEESLALSLGGEDDAGKDMHEEGRLLLNGEAERRRIPLINEKRLEDNVRRRMLLYEEAARGKRIGAFLNIGGGWANMGTDSEILKVKPGLAGIRNIPPSGERGVIFEMAFRKIPVIHLLHIKGLADRYSLPWDPVPFPEAGKGRIYKRAGERQPFFLILAVVYFFSLTLVLALSKKRASRITC